MLALVELRQGQAAEAMQHVSELREANPDDVSVMVLEGEINLYQGDFESAAAAFNLAVRHGAGRRSVLREFQARVVGEISAPEASLESWLGSNPDDAVIRIALAQYYLQTQSGEKAIREFEAVVQQQPDNAAVLNNLAWQYQQVGELDKALDAATRAYELNSESGAIADTLGWIYRDLGQLEKSRELLSGATRLSPDNGEIEFHLAAVMVESGDSEKARRILEDLIASDSQFPSRAEAEALLGGL
jgi:FimV-like protein